jgi:uncharacterized tellurite resistance protein B-like protein
VGLEEVESLVDRDMQLMEPTYLQEKNQNSDTLRRLLYTAGVAVANASGGVEPAELEALGRLLGSDHGDEVVDAAKVIGDLDGRIKDALEVPLLYRAQLVQHLTIVAAADGNVSPEELHVMEDIARGSRSARGWSTRRSAGRCTRSIEARRDVVVRHRAPGTAACGRWGPIRGGTGVAEGGAC